MFHAVLPRSTQNALKYYLVTAKAPSLSKCSTVCAKQDLGRKHNILQYVFPSSSTFTKSVTMSDAVSTGNSSGDEIANVNFFYDNIFTFVYAVLPKAAEFGKITHNKGHYAVRGHSRSPILVPIESSYTTSYW